MTSRADHLLKIKRGTDVGENSGTVHQRLTRVEDAVSSIAKTFEGMGGFMTEFTRLAQNFEHHVESANETTTRTFKRLEVVEEAIRGDGKDSIGLVGHAKLIEAKLDNNTWLTKLIVASGVAFFFATLIAGVILFMYTHTGHP